MEAVLLSSGVCLCVNTEGQLSLVWRLQPAVAVLWWYSGFVLLPQTSPGEGRLVSYSSGVLCGAQLVDLGELICNLC